jgi:hypothetical protein
VTPEELPAYLDALAVQAGRAAGPAVMGMARAYQDEVKSLLGRLSHPPHTFTPSPPGSPPAETTGRLRQSVLVRPGHGGPVATASVAPHTIYAAVQEYGDVMHPTHFEYMHWYTNGRPYWKKEVRVPPRPYMRPALVNVITSGALTAAAMREFARYVLPAE